MSSERRSRIDRRHLNLVREPLERFGERRGEERRTSPRVTQRLWVVDPNETGLPQVHEGEIGLGGASWWTRYPPLSDRVDSTSACPRASSSAPAPACCASSTTMEITACRCASPTCR